MTRICVRVGDGTGRSHNSASSSLLNKSLNIEPSLHSVAAPRAFLFFLRVKSFSVLVTEYWAIFHFSHTHTHRQHYPPTQNRVARKSYIEAIVLHLWVGGNNVDGLKSVVVFFLHLFFVRSFNLFEFLRDDHKSHFTETINVTYDHQHIYYWHHRKYVYHL